MIHEGYKDLKIYEDATQKHVFRDDCGRGRETFTSSN